MNKYDIKIKFKIIELLSKTMAKQLVQGEAITNFNFDIKADAKLNAESKIVLITVDVDIREFNKKEVLGAISVGFVFEIENFSEVIQKQDNETYLIPPEIDVFLKSAAIATTRGIMFSEFRGTYLYNSVLPFVVLPSPQIEKTKTKEVKAN